MIQKRHVEDKKLQHAIEIVQQYNPDDAYIKLISAVRKQDKNDAHRIHELQLKWFIIISVAARVLAVKRTLEVCD